MKIAKIVPGGQTVVDRGAIEAACEAGFPYGGLIPWNAGTVTNFFIHAPEEDRAARMVEKYSELTPAKAHDQVAKEDKQRSSYYNYYTNKSWGAASSYDLTLDSSTLGIEGCVRIIKEALNVKPS